MREQHCKGCGARFFSGHPSRTFCDYRCRQKFYAKKYKERNGERIKLPSGTVGAIHELVVAADLMKAGFYVFRSLSPHGPGDLAILKDKHLIIVEVTTGFRAMNNKLSYPKHNKKIKQWDVIAVVEYNGTITYIPPIFRGDQQSPYASHVASQEIPAK